MKIIPIASGKGGVGKSLVAANLSIALAAAGKKVLVADLDLGASNLHLLLGFDARLPGLGSYLSNTKSTFDKILYKTDYENLFFVPGDSEIPGLANITHSQKKQIARQLLSVPDMDYVILDLGAGTSATILDFFLLSGRGIVVTTPTLTATLNAYVFLKNAVFRLMWDSFKPRSKARELLTSLKKDGASLQRAYIPDILDRIKKIDPSSYSAFEMRMKKLSPRLILNMLEDPKDAEKAQKIRRSCREYLGMDLEHLGIVYRDDMQDIALSSRMAIIKYKPQSILSQAIYRIADKIISSETDDDSFLDPEYLDDSYGAAYTEAESDFESKLDYVQDLLASGTLTQGDLIETVRMQQYEIAQLRKENNFYKAKVAKALAQGAKL